MGDLLGALKGTIVNFVVRKVKKMVPAFSLPTAIGFNKVLAEGARLPFKAGHAGPRRHRLPAVHRRHHRRVEGRRAAAPERDRQRAAERSMAAARRSTRCRRVPQPQFVCALPLYHIYSLTVCALMGMRLGGMNVLIPNPRDIPGFVKELAKYKINIFPAVNTLYNALLNNPDFAKLDFSSYKVCNGGGMAVQQAGGREVAGGDRHRRSSKATACPRLRRWSTANRCDIKEFTGTIGLPYPSTEIAILDDDGKPVPLGTAGEIAIRGPQVMAGYWQRDDETAKAMTPDGFFKTGDVGIMDERGYTRIVDRKKDMILVSGFNVYPNEVEEVVAGHPGVLEVRLHRRAGPGFGRGGQAVRGRARTRR